VTIYLLAPYMRVPVGGVRTLYETAELLTSLGHRAVVAGYGRGDPQHWFDSTALSTRARDVTLAPDDLVLINAVYARRPLRRQCCARVAIFNQGGYNALRFPMSADEASRFAGVISVSERSHSQAAAAYPGLNRMVVRLPQNHLVADALEGAGTSRGREVLIMNRKRLVETKYLMDELPRRLPAGWSLTNLTGMTNAGVERAMKRASIFISLSFEEGLGLPPLEAMARGCYVVGYTGAAGDEFMQPEWCTVIPDGDITGLLTSVVETAARLDADPSCLQDAVRRGQEVVQQQYAPEVVRETWTAALEMLTAAPSPARPVTNRLADVVSVPARTRLINLVRHARSIPARVMSS
jgi:glycosyltransferase involved in cell wall biosynthesis